ncbi:MAG: oxaloacetate decarboxylase subunit alpha, partial [Eubacteriales bacterium]|nr:oxaloacetate decarboxylase subunit alpha [Eubacteriales bacterium]
RGEYGKTPAPISPEFSKRILGSETPITNRPADALKPELENLRREIKAYSEQDEDVLTYALFDKVAETFFKKRQEQKYKLDSDHMDTELKIHSV